MNRDIILVYLNILCKKKRNILLYYYLEFKLNIISD